MTADRALFELLGLDGPGALTRVAHAAPPEALRAEGAPLRALLALVATALAWQPAVDDLPELSLYRAEVESGFLAVPPEALVGVVTGTPVTGGELVGFDTRGERVVVRIAGADGRAYVVDARDGHVDVHVEADALDGLDAPAAAPADVGIPDVASWASAAQAEGWLAETAVRLAAGPSAVERAAAAGVLARLWTPPEGGAIAAADHPRERVRAWVGALPADTLAALETRAVERAWALVERIADLDGLPDPVRDAEVASLVRDRDDLQSVRRALRLGGAGSRLAEALALVDRTAAEHMSALADHLPALDADPDADRWSAVAWQEPDAWWAGVS